MKKCPFCKAEIEENARFCLYCMTSLEEKQEIAIPKQKNKRWLVVLAAVLVFVIIILSIFFAFRKESRNTGTDGFFSESKTSPESDSDKPANDTNIAADDLSKNNGSTKKNRSSVSDDNDSISNGSQTNTPAGNNNLGTNQPTGTTDTGNTSSGATDSNTTPSNGQENVDNTPPTSTLEPSVSTATYLYRDAKYGDDFSVSANLDNCVVITGVSTASSNGEYIIPETLGGKRVVSIMGLAFCDANIKNTVKKVVVPASVKTIWNNAFANCYNLTDIYFCGKAIYVEGNAFAPKSNRNGTLTIHCSYDCSDRNYRYYRNSAVYYDAEYKEWNN